jgi:hypothetical protein
MTDEEGLKRPIGIAKHKAKPTPPTSESEAEAESEYDTDAEWREYDTGPDQTISAQTAHGGRSPALGDQSL